jgi:transcriptional regulator NrdR family protein
MRIVNKDGAKEEFEDGKLYDSVYYPAREAELSEEEANELADKVLYEIKAWFSEHDDNVFSSKEVREKVISILERENDDTCFLYKTHLDLN